VQPVVVAGTCQDPAGACRNAWLLSRRVAAARTLLEETDLPIEAVATRVGLASSVNLRRRFRTQVGTTPGCLPAGFPRPV